MGLISEKAVAKDPGEIPSPGPSSVVLFLLRQGMVEPQCDGHLEVVQVRKVLHEGSAGQDEVVRSIRQLMPVTENPEKLSRC